MALEKPQRGEPLDKLWEYVAAITDKLNALENVNVVIQSPYPTQGRLDIHDTFSTLTLY